MSNKILEAMMAIGSFIGLCLMLYFTIQIIICDYEMWKRNKKEKDCRHKMEDKFKNRKLTD